MSKRYCIKCGKEIKSYVSTDEHQSLIWKNGIVDKVFAGFGSSFNGNMYVIAICDNCMMNYVLGKESLKDKIYSWMLKYFPERLMYTKYYVDSHKMYKPRWGWTKRDILYAKYRAENFNNNIKWE